MVSLATVVDVCLAESNGGRAFFLPAPELARIQVAAEESIAFIVARRRQEQRTALVTTPAKKKIPISVGTGTKGGGCTARVAKRK